MQALNELIELNKQKFTEHFHSGPEFIAYAPGRINIIGEHTDYNMGLSMPCAINRWALVSVAPNNSGQIKIVSVNYSGSMIYTIGEKFEPKDSWQKYIYGCLLLFSKSNPIAKGFNAVITGNVPIGSGASSSAALEVAFMNALNYFYHAQLDSLALIKLCQQVEHQYLQVKSGLLDQYASQFSKEGKVMLLDFEKLSHKYIPAHIDDYVWVLCDTKVKRSLAGSKYSERVEETQKALAILKEKKSSIHSFRDIKEEDISLLEDENQKKRIRHYVTENKRTTDALKAFESNDMNALGKLLTASHHSLQHDYEVSCTELGFLVDTALKTGHCLGSRMMGGGFGGCTINLVKKDKAEAFSKEVSEAYQKQFHIDTEVNIYQSVNGAGIDTL